MSQLSNQDLVFLGLLIDHVDDPQLGIFSRALNIKPYRDYSNDNRLTDFINQLSSGWYSLLDDFPRNKLDEYNIQAKKLKKIVCSRALRSLGQICRSKAPEFFEIRSRRSPLDQSEFATFKFPGILSGNEFVVKFSRSSIRLLEIMSNSYGFSRAKHLFPEIFPYWFLDYLRLAVQIVFVSYETYRISYSLVSKKYHSSMIIDSLVGSVIEYFDLLLSDSWSDVIKFHSLYQFARHENDVLPETKAKIYNKPGRILSGRLGELMYRDAGGLKKRNITLRYHLMDALKKGLPHLSPWKMQDAANNHRGRLLVKRSSSHILKSKIREITSDLFPRGLIFEDFLETHLTERVSSNASFDYSKADGGNLMELMDMCDIDFQQLMLSDYFYGFSRCDRQNKTFEIRGPYWVPSAGLKIFRKWFLNFGTRHPKVQVKFILEPLKIRTITKGTFETNNLWSNVQRFMWKRMKEFPQFSLIGRPVETSDIEWLMEKTLERNLLFGRDWFFNSGDFSAATDNLNADCTMAVISELCDCITHNEIESTERNERCTAMMQVMMNNLTEPTIYYDSCYPDKMKDKLIKPEPFKMSNGQLMGFSLSFPILCIVNLACYACALEEYCNYNKLWSLRSLPILINGDDNLSIQNPVLFDLWKKWTLEAGFDLSVGKNYCSDKFAFINSSYYRVKSKSFLPRYSMGWITGVKKGDTEFSEDPILRIRSVIKEFHQLPDPIKTRCFETFYHYNEKLLCHSHLPLGGEVELGFDLPVESHTNSLNFAIYIGKKGFSIDSQSGFGDNPSHLKGLYSPFSILPKMDLFYELSDLWNSYRLKPIRVFQPDDLRSLALKSLVSMNKQWIEEESRYKDDLVSPGFADEECSLTNYVLSGEDNRDVFIDESHLQVHSRQYLLEKLVQDFGISVLSFEMEPEYRLSDFIF